MAAVGEAGNSENQALLDEINALKAENALLKEEIALLKAENTRNTLIPIAGVQQGQYQNTADCTTLNSSPRSSIVTSKEAFKQVFLPIPPKADCMFIQSWNSENPLPSNTVSWVEIDVQIHSDGYEIGIGVGIPEGHSDWEHWAHNGCNDNDSDWDGEVYEMNATFHGWCAHKAFRAGRYLGEKSGWRGWEQEQENAVLKFDPLKCELSLYHTASRVKHTIPIDNVRFTTLFVNIYLEGNCAVECTHIFGLEDIGLKEEDFHANYLESPLMILEHPIISSADGNALHWDPATFTLTLRDTAAKKVKFGDRDTRKYGYWALRQDIINAWEITILGGSPDTLVIGCAEVSGQKIIGWRGEADGLAKFQIGDRLRFGYNPIAICSTGALVAHPCVKCTMKYRVFVLVCSTLTPVFSSYQKNHTV